MTDASNIDFLNRKVAEYNQPSFIEKDPISVPHRYTLQQDKEIAGFFAAVFAWGNRAIIIKKCAELMQRMDNSPYEFIVGHHEKERKKLLGFKHRTFNDTDLLYFVEFLQQHYRQYDTLETAFTRGIKKNDYNTENALTGFYNYFFSLEDVPGRTTRHIASPAKKSTCKRLSMFLRWMVRTDEQGVDFGIWKKIQPHQLICPVDLHVARVARRFNLLRRSQNDWQTAVELTETLKKLDPQDPVKYDFALFGLGVMEKFQ